MLLEPCDTLDQLLCVSNEAAKFRASFRHLVFSKLQVVAETKAEQYTDSRAYTT